MPDFGVHGHNLLLAISLLASETVVGDCLISQFPFIRQLLPSIPFNSDGLAEDLVHYNENEHLAYCYTFIVAYKNNHLHDIYAAEKVFVLFYHLHLKHSQTPH